MDFHKQVEMIHVYRKEYGAKPYLNSKSSSFDKFMYYIREKGKGLKIIWASGNILDGNSSGRFFRDYLEGHHEEDGLDVLYKVEGIGDDKFPYRYFTSPQRANATQGKYYQGVL
ncbi:hypothetical protein [Bartonella sp. CB169]|uniref:hypothetical protein n=1 Tax=Bartonella sp. CB169 TaxID=3112257 RepID=UPI00300DE6C3